MIRSPDVMAAMRGAASRGDPIEPPIGTSSGGQGKPPLFCEKATEMMENYRRGRYVEYMARDHLKKKGCATVRSAGSRSPVDLVAWSQSMVRFIQVKRTQQFVGGVQ
jgi:hypothetical protein